MYCQHVVNWILILFFFVSMVHCRGRLIDPCEQVGMDGSIIPTSDVLFDGSDRSVLLYPRIRKTGSTTVFTLLQNVLEGKLGAGKICSFYRGQGVVQSLNTQNSISRRCKLVTGHFFAGLDLLMANADQASYVFSFRDPVATLESYLNFIGSPKDLGSTKAPGDRMREALRNPTFWARYSKYSSVVSGMSADWWQFRQYHLNSGVVSELATNLNYTGHFSSLDEEAEWLTQVYLYRCALARICRNSFPLVLERFEDSLILLAKSLQLPLTAFRDYNFENVNAKKQSLFLNSTKQALLAGPLFFDELLYRNVINIIDLRLRSIPRSELDTARLAFEGVNRTVSCRAHLHAAGCDRVWEQKP